MEKKVKIVILVLASIYVGYSVYVDASMKNESNYVVTSVKQNDKRVYWAALHRVTGYELYHTELEVRYHYGSISKQDIDFSQDSATMVGYEVIDYFNFAGFTIIEDNMKRFNSTDWIVANLLSKYNLGGKLVW